MVSLISTHFDQICSSLQVTVGHPVCESSFSFCSVIIDHYPLASVLITSAVSIHVIWVLLLFVSVFVLFP